MITIPGYKIIKLIGQGGMASVYLAIQESVGRNVAIKIMSPSLASDPSFSARFLKEARMASLIHPHIISVFDAGEIDGQNYIVMEYASGGNLETALKKGLGLERISEIVKQIASALHFSASKGFIHRDVKPENILIREDGSAILVDFGIAKAMSTGTKLTVVGTTIGSPNYMSPEQARGLTLDGRSDLYSLGIVLFEALTGRKPFDAEDTFVIGLKHINDPIPALPNELQAFQAIIDKLLAKDPQERYNNGQELIDALNNMTIHGEQILSAATPLHAQQTAPVIGGNETTIVDDSTRVAAIDRTRIKSSTDEKTRIKPAAEKTSNTSLSVSLVIIALLAVASIWVWWQSQQVDLPTQPPVIEEQPEIITKVETKPSVQPQEKMITPDDKIDSQQTKIDELLKKAELAMQQNKLTTPKKQNALYFYRQVLSIDGTHEKTHQGIAAIANAYHDLGNQQYERRAYKKALTFVDKGLAINAQHKQLRQLRDKILKDQDQEARYTALFADHNTVIKAEANITAHTGKHIGGNEVENYWYTRQDLINRIYDQILKQCNNQADAFNHPDCIFSYERFVQQWPLPLIATRYTLTEKDGDLAGEIRFDQQQAKAEYETLLNRYRDEIQRGIKTGFTTKEQLITLANYDLHTSLAALFGIKTNKNIQQILHTNIENHRKKKPIEHIDSLVDIIKQLAKNKKIHVKPFTTKNSYEITPFAAQLYQTISDKIETSDAPYAQAFLYGETEVTADGTQLLDLWLFDNNNTLIDFQAMILDGDKFSSRRTTPIIFNHTVFPKTRLKKAYGFPTELSIGEQTANALLIVGDQTDLKVKLDYIGFYFIAVHVKRSNEEYSYLLPLHEAQIPFIQVATRKNANKLVTLGSFKVTPPVGVEVIQLVASSVNLEKHLPAYQWDDNKKQFIIQGSMGNIEKGLQAVRDKANTINENSHKDGTLWQEKLLVTSILDNV